MLAAAVTVVLAGLTGCASTVSLTPAPDANDPACAEVMVRIPAVVDGQSRRFTDAQATAAWGDPSAVLLTCGVAQLGPTTLPCRSVDGVDWVIDDADAPRYRVTSFNRAPAVEVFLDNDVVSSAQVLESLSAAVVTLPTNDAVCTGVEEDG